MSLECVKTRRHYNYGFIDPNQVNVTTVDVPQQREQTEENLLEYFKKNDLASKILLPYNFK